MRLLPLVILAACERHAKQPETVVLVDELWNRVLVEKKPTAEAADFHFGCKLAAVKDYAVVQCPDRDLFVRFHCADHPGPEHALEFVVRDEGFKLYCR